jgi:hypothetical protein
MNLRTMLDAIERDNVHLEREIERRARQRDEERGARDAKRAGELCNAAWRNGAGRLTVIPIRRFRL